MTKEQFLDTFQFKLYSKFSGTQKWWTKSLFHFTDITNAISILNHGKIYSRKKAVVEGVMQNDNANDNVIFHTNDTYKKYVRLYFGPSIPTQKK